jgi:carotenoid cleavage dioxygenase-like enzyme
VFIEPNNITFVKHIIRTNKWVYESEHGTFLKHPFFIPFYIFAHKIGIIPNVLDLANTAFLSVKNKTYTLFERDFPYEIKIENNEITTLHKVDIPHIESFSGHSKYDGSYIHTIDYDVVTKKIKYIRFDENFREDSHNEIQMKYIPLVHDFSLLQNGILFMDAPFRLDFSKHLPVVLDTILPGYFHVLKYKGDINHTIYSCKHPFYIFHYANVIEHVNGTIEIYAPCYDTIDFAGLDIQGKYRKIVITPDSNEVIVYKNDELERMNLDFPTVFNEYVILREITNRTISGFVLCKDHEFIKRVQLPVNRFFCGEPGIVEQHGCPVLVGLSYDESYSGYICVLNIFTNEYIEYPLNTTVSIGFHSLLRLL